MSAAARVRLVVGFSPGSLSAKVAQLIGPALSRALGAAVDIDHRPGDNGAAAAAIVAAAPADGCTLFMATLGTHAVAPSVHATLPYHPIRDFQPVALLASAPMVLVARTSLEIAAVSALVDRDKRRAALTCASSVMWGAPYLAATLFAERTGVRLKHVIYGDTDRLFEDLITGRVDLSFNNAISAKPHIDAGRLRGLAATSCTRARGLPLLPTLTELGIPGCEMDNWVGIVTSRATPPKTIARLAIACARALNDRGVRRALTDAAMTVDALGPAAFAERLAQELARCATLVRRADTEGANHGEPGARRRA